MRGLMMGRFQPFHLGHLDLAKQILEQCDEVIIAVTSAQFNYLEKDPFTSGERIEMIHNSLKDENLDLKKCFVISLENQFNVATWASYLKSALPHFDKVYSGNDYVSMLLSDSGIKVAKPKFLDRNQFNATKIRSMIKSDENWKDSVPNAVYEFLTKINAKNRLSVISKSDTNPTKH
ncbi:MULTISPECIES: nicotinamide-nucleotide adenylyltransferase [Nitrosopumilus]|uniref:Nicotinamide-nucleotide adenylyltransferase n=1 Tax=Nitrosopumilus piranensis TaxID=1582439 RepID=A0A0C5BVW7_9ARCH|nr:MULTISPECIES: nicotinamide-nucleotide adenylyltransferase [Nitrosopumilus]AJM92416.1 Nicotinamide-nucleotide adenylyltransferase [Nitrosopumilus piranensis]KAF6244330.1 nicotinamide-nucleotide adenylyltransferase [Nitrosopumilus sp. b2]